MMRQIKAKKKPANLMISGLCVPDGGDKRDRTADLLNAIQALSQLSYSPIFTNSGVFLAFWFLLPGCLLIQAEP